jgi:hypothetical protein
VPADLNFDGVLDEADWLVFIAGSEEDLSGLTEIQQYAAGDLDGDGQNSIGDFVIFKQAYLDVHGEAGFAALFHTVPEASTCVLAVLAWFGTLLRRGHRVVEFGAVR